MKEWKSYKHNQRRRKEMWWKLSPQRVIVMWMKVISPVKVPIS
ncbi:hypothetical protein AB205_0052370 [Aquarana catesbeiana]|uniref:Uncharacterized protein n=1 Tax=Aquarana catesbeiana TaxID=8400 RepID=A0A2G9QBN7_AQUCT|nr:hypothetical protein AB205_0052370 [Aquarana catesbeiana]